MSEAQHDSPGSIAREQIDRFGYLVAENVYGRWCGGHGAPLWREAFESQKVSKFFEEANISEWHSIKEMLMRRAAGRGWVVYGSEPRSLRFGPTFLASTVSKTSVCYPDAVGRRIASSVGGFMKRHGRYPTASDLVLFMRNPNGTHVFRTESEFVKNLPWLTISGWVLYEDCEIHCGATAIADDVERATRHHLKREARLSARGGSIADRRVVAVVNGYAKV
ncbi:hypothetical protein [Mycobacterium sp. 29Ha]|uniref:hypothetical protein n=1 Tax=Mycobacterium sp. 29Ha TaxID=2939268 RepID=UPI00293948D8|nr:hypothetical protein [Mycobacterium sp. 29Ha]MDV3131371.1 hypothetical protein [Mycobacterium sp. 29Ha]